MTNRPEGSDKRRRPTRTIPLQYLWGRAPRIDLYADRLRLILPIYFGRKAIEVPLDQVAVTPVYLSSEKPSIIADQGITEDGLSIPYLFTRFTTLLRDIPGIRPPNLMLVFATPARVPPLRKLEYTRVSLPFGYISSRAENGVTIDGALLCVTSPDALHQLAASGVEAVSDWRTWLRAHPRNDVAIRQDRKAADQHFVDLTRNLLVVWVLFLAAVVAAIVIYSLAT
ncbi:MULTISPECIES: hypothetical protein [unclassified Pseudofrankia]|uniref:hypothetical protein n=1 Tax=unclassified Pseudofrankia TaxID=2994372 RepID=UPI0008DA9B0E|nr:MULTISPECIES: hypothetical protein [unclassified Pseudofrankia]MDT3440643.1 hypothetical protein [Pseudofrankia sp. BMG5.37]OHV60573.1 hypothetical protein BCD48_05410 [Pseudofrankia sp. BMG5.36]